MTQNIKFKLQFKSRMCEYFKDQTVLNKITDIKFEIYYLVYKK